MIAATLVCALSYLPFSTDLASYRIGAAELFLAVAFLYYAYISLPFAVWP